MKCECVWYVYMWCVVCTCGVCVVYMWCVCCLHVVCDVYMCCVMCVHVLCTQLCAVFIFVAVSHVPVCARPHIPTMVEPGACDTNISSTTEFSVHKPLCNLITVGVALNN